MSLRSLKAPDLPAIIPPTMSSSLPKALSCLPRTVRQQLRPNVHAPTRSPPRRSLSSKCPHSHPPQHLHLLSTTTLPSPKPASTRPASRSFHATPAHAYKTVQEARSRYRSGPFSTTAALVFLTAGAAMIFYFRYEKARVERKRVAEAAKGMGRPKVGGAFELVDQDGKVVTEAGMRGRFSLVSGRPRLGGDSGEGTREVRARDEKGVLWEIHSVVGIRD